MHAPELRPLEKVLQDIRDVFAGDGVAGVEGFRIAMRSDKGAQMIMEWGSTVQITKFPEGKPMLQTGQCPHPYVFTDTSSTAVRKICGVCRQVVPEWNV